LLEARQVLVELAVERARVLVVVEGQDDVRHVGRPGGRCFQIGRGAQISALLKEASSDGFGEEAVVTRTRDSHLDNVADSSGVFINNNRLQPRRSADDL